MARRPGPLSRRVNGVIGQGSLPYSTPPHRPIGMWVSRGCRPIAMESVRQHGGTGLALSMAKVIKIAAAQC